MDTIMVWCDKCDQPSVIEICGARCVTHNREDALQELRSLHATVHTSMKWELCEVCTMIRTAMVEQSAAPLGGIEQYQAEDR